LLLLVQKPFLKGPWSVGRGRGHNFPLCLKGKHNGLPQAGCSTACSWSALFGQLACFGRLVQEAGSVFHACHAHAATHMHEALVSLPWPASAIDRRPRGHHPLHMHEETYGRCRSAACSVQQATLPASFFLSRWSKVKAHTCDCRSAVTAELEMPRKESLIFQ
jgi:hypothetical protein